jgi:hypothetical protein
MVSMDPPTRGITSYGCPEMGILTYHLQMTRYGILGSTQQRYHLGYQDMPDMGYLLR